MKVYSINILYLICNKHKNKYRIKINSKKRTEI